MSESEWGMVDITSRWFMPSAKEEVFARIVKACPNDQIR